MVESLEGNFYTTNVIFLFEGFLNQLTKRHSILDEKYFYRFENLVSKDVLPFSGMCYKFRSMGWDSGIIKSMDP